MLNYLRGTLLVEVTGAALTRCMNRWTAADLSFWDFQQCSELVFQCKIYEKEYERIRREAGRAQCDVRILSRSGLPSVLARLRARPILVVGTAAMLGLAIFLQSFVWFFRVSGNSRVPSEDILRALDAEGVCFGAWGPALDSEDLKNRMLNRVPELRWLAVNREGGLVTVLTAEREAIEPPVQTEGVAHLVATRPGVIRELHVINGFAQKVPGDAAQAGEILISGTMEWTTHMQATRAMGEVYADTLHLAQLVCPSTALKKVYTGRTEVCRTIIFQRNRRKISGNSGIFGTMCDRMIETKVWTLPGNYALPITTETVILREYTLEPVPLRQTDAEQLLSGEALRLTEASMIAGTVETASTEIKKEKEKDAYTCSATLNCLELISRTVPVELFGEDDTNGEANQRGTD